MWQTLDEMHDDEMWDMIVMRVGLPNMVSGHAITAKIAMQTYVDG
jgi:hypothetical protein